MRLCRNILSSPRHNNEKEFDPDHFNFRGNNYPMIDIWGLACSHLLNNVGYKKTCLEHSYLSATGLYFSTNAENAMRYLEQKFGFIEDHTALSDAEIETIILFKALKRGKIIQGIVNFPFKILGETFEFAAKHNISYEMEQNLLNRVKEYLPDEICEFNNYEKQLYRKLQCYMDGGYEE